MTQMFNSKRANITGKVSVMIGLVVIISMLVALAPTMFSGLNNISGAPTWVNTVLPLIVGASIVLLLWRTVGK